MFPAWSQHKLALVLFNLRLIQLFFCFTAMEVAHFALCLLFYTAHFNDIFKSPSHFVFLRIITRIKKTLISVPFH